MFRKVAPCILKLQFSKWNNSTFLTFGHRIFVQADHRSLQNIMKKPQLSAPNCVQQMLLGLECYDVRISCYSGKLLMF